MQAQYPMTQEALGFAVQEFSQLIAQVDNTAIVELRYGYNVDEYLILVRTQWTTTIWHLNINTGDWVKDATHWNW